VWFRNTWSWGREGEGYGSSKPLIEHASEGLLRAAHPTLGSYRLAAAAVDGASPQPLFTENETNGRRLFGVPSGPHTKDGFHDYVIRDARDAVNPEGRGTKAAFHYRLTIPAGEQTTIQLRLTAEGEAPAHAFGREFDASFARRIADADAYYSARLPEGLNEEERSIE